MVCCVIPLEQVLVWDTFSLKHGQLQTLSVTEDDNVMPKHVGDTIHN
jgi:hypothetical protein